jgi:hypothetical protein
VPFIEQLVAVALLCVALTCCFLLARTKPIDTGGTVGAALLVVLAVVWSRVPGAYEGPTVVSVTDTHGMTVADLVVVPCVGIAAALFARARESNRRGRG